MDLSQQIERLNELEEQLNKEIQFNDDTMLLDVRNTPPLWWKQSVPLPIPQNRKKIINLQKEHNRYLQKKLDLLKNKSRFVEIEESLQEKRFATRVKQQREYITLLEQERMILEALEGVKDASSPGLINQNLDVKNNLKDTSIVEKDGDERAYASDSIVKKEIDLQTISEASKEQEDYKYKVDFFTPSTPQFKYKKGYFAIRQNSVTIFYYESETKDYFFSQPLEKIIHEFKETFAKDGTRETGYIDVVYINANDCDKKYFSNVIEKNKRKKDALHLPLSKPNRHFSLENQLSSKSKMALNGMLSSIVDVNKIYVFENVENILNHEDLSYFTSYLSANKNNTIVLFTSEYMIAKRITGARVYNISSKENPAGNMISNFNKIRGDI